MAKTIKPLTNSQVLGLKPNGARYFKAVDNDGLYVRVTPSSKSWVMRDFGESRSWIAISNIDDMPMALARQKIADKKRAAGLVKGEVALMPLFKDHQDTFIASVGKSLKNDKNLKQWTSTVKEFCMNPDPKKGRDLSNKRIDEITATDIKEIMECVLPRKVTAQKLRGRLERMIDAAWIEHRINTPYINPASSKVVNQLLPVMAKKPKAKHHAAVPVGDAPEIFQLCWKKRKTSVSYAALCFTILTIGRAGNGVTARWDEIADGVWIPGSMKVDDNPTHVVPLSKKAQELVELRRVIVDGESDWVFASPTKDQPLSTDSLRHDLQRVCETSYTTHGWRSTFKDWSMEDDEDDLSVDVLGEVALSHSVTKENVAKQKTDMKTTLALGKTVGSKTKAAYMRTKLFKKRQKLLQDWEDYLFS